MMRNENAAKGVSAMSAALGLLTKKAYTNQELIRKMEQKGFDEEEIEKTIQKLREWNYMNDADYAMRFCREKRGRQSRAWIKRELFRRGITAEQINMALVQEYSEEKETMNCREEIRKLIGENKTPLQNGNKDKIWAKLYRRGYPLDTIKKNWQEIEDEMNQN